MQTVGERIFISAEEAAGLLADDAERIHSTTAGPVFIGADWEREKVLEAFQKARKIEIAGPAARSMGHPIVVWDRPDHRLFFAADLGKVDALCASLELVEGKLTHVA